MSQIITLPKLAQLALENDADFEVFHGETTHKDKRVRAQMVLLLNNCPAVRILFGDKKHEQRLSSIVLDRNPKINVKLEHLLRAMESNSTERMWNRNLVASDTPLFNLTPTADGKVRVTGRIVPGSFNSSMSVSGDTFWDHMRLTVSNHVRPLRGEIQETEPTILNVVAPYNEELSVNRDSGEELTFTGDYIFPDTIQTATNS